MKREIRPLLFPGGEIWIQFFAASPDPNYKEISRRFVIPKDWDEYEEMVNKVISTGMFAEIGPIPAYWIVPEEEYKDWYRSTERIGGTNPYNGHLSNKKWPLKKVM